MLNEYFNKNKVPVMIACLQWFITTILQIDRLFFTYEAESQMMILVKILYFILLLITWLFIFDVYKKIKDDNENYKRGFTIFCGYLTIIFLLLLVLWPGTWSWDDAWSLIGEHRYEWITWQHILTGIYQEVLLQILPFPGGIILLQNVGISLSVAFVIVKLENSFNIPQLKNNYLDFVIKIIPFLTPPVLMYQFSGYRIGIYVYIELTMLVMWICAIKDKRVWTWKYLVLFALLCAVTATFRTEALFYVPCASIAILFTKKNVLPTIKKMVCIALIICIYFAINNVQNEKLGNNSYKLISILRPCAELVHAADPVEDKEYLDGLSSALNLEVIYNNPEVNGEDLYWGYGAVKSEHTEEDYKTCLKAFVKLCLKYPNIVIHERMNLFIKSTGITGDANTNMGSAYFYDADSGSTVAEEIKNLKWIANQPVFYKARKIFIHFLNFRYNDHVFAIYRVVWNAMIPLIILLYAWCKTIQKRQWYIWLLMTAVLIRLPVVVLTQPSGWIMYFMSFYFLGYVTLFYVILYYMGKRKKITER